MRLDDLAIGLFFAACELSFRTLGLVDDTLLRGAVLDTLLGPQESFEYSSTTSPGPHQPHS